MGEINSVIGGVLEKVGFPAPEANAKPASADKPAPARGVGESDGGWLNELKHKVERDLRARDDIGLSEREFAESAAKNATASLKKAEAELPHELAKAKAEQSMGLAVAASGRFDQLNEELNVARKTFNSGGVANLKEQIRAAAIDAQDKWLTAHIDAVTSFGADSPQAKACLRGLEEAKKHVPPTGEPRELSPDERAAKVVAAKQKAYAAATDFEAAVTGERPHDKLQQLAIKAAEIYLDLVVGVKNRRAVDSVVFTVGQLSPARMDEEISGHNQVFGAVKADDIPKNEDKKIADARNLLAEVTRTLKPPQWQRAEDATKRATFLKQKLEDLVPRFEAISKDLAAKAASNRPEDRNLPEVRDHVAILGLEIDQINKTRADYLSARRDAMQAWTDAVNDSGNQFRACEQARRRAELALPADISTGLE
jgi:hypothetical protein